MDLGTVVLARKNPGNETIIEHGENGLLFQTPKVFSRFIFDISNISPFENYLYLKDFETFWQSRHLSLQQLFYIHE